MSQATIEHSFQAINPATGEILPGEFIETSLEQITDYGHRSAAAFAEYRNVSGLKKAEFLEQIALEIEALGDALLERAQAETALPLPRLTGERGRTTGQLRLFASYVREGSWVDARIDPALPERQPLPRPDLRQMLRPLGPVGIFGASNFPLAFSVAGGDTASALAAGCTVVVKAHPAHPGTSELVAEAIRTAVQKCNLPEDTFLCIQGRTNETGQALVNHPAIKAIGFTGSFRGGKAIFDAAARRPEPIPVYAEMGSTNPVFFLPQILKEQGAALAQAYVASTTLGTGQFCTNPGLSIVTASEATEQFKAQAQQAITQVKPTSMLTKAIREAFHQGISHLTSHGDVQVLGESDATEGYALARPVLLTSTAKALLANPAVAEEVFGPSSIIVQADNPEEMLALAQSLEGHLTATVYGTEEELLQYGDLLAILEQKAGRVIINAFPTGVEVSHAMHHGGPFPATTDARSTSVGTNAIRRFARPVCYQGFPQALLPEELKDTNPLSIWRLWDGVTQK